MRPALLLCLALAAGCPARQQGPTGESGSGEKPDQKRSDMDASQTAGKMPACADLACLTQHEGEMIEADGTFVFPKEKAFARNKLSLGDGTTIILSQPADDAVRGVLTGDNDGKRMKVQGRIYTKDIPEKYRIIGRGPEPYLVDIASVSVDG
jgi:hypothetical protein